MRLPPLSLVAALGAFLLAGCPHVVRPTQPWSDAQQALRAHDSLRARVRSLRAEARADQRGAQGRVRGTVLMFVERPDRVRFDVMTQFGPAAVLTSDGRTFAMADLRERTFRTGRACPSSIARLLGMPLSSEDVGRLLLGGTPRIESVRETIAVDEEDGRYRIVLYGRDRGRQEIDLGVRAADEHAPPAEQRLRLLRSEVFDARGRTLWRVTYDDYRVVPLGEQGVAVPYEVFFEHPGRESDTRLRFEDIDLNVAVPAGAFEQTPAPGLRVERIACDEDAGAAGGRAADTGAARGRDPAPGGGEDREEAAR